jgi:hypothetical protein
MTKAELVALVHERTAVPLGRTFRESALDDLIKNGLVSPAARQGNDGRRPRYRFTWRDVHRVQFLVLMQSRGVTRRDALRLRLFVAGCRLPLWEVRQALLSEYRAAAATLNGQTRTSYLDNEKPLTPAKLASVTREIGRADQILRDAGLEMAPEAVIPIVRAARQKPLPVGLGSLSPDILIKLAEGNTSITELATVAGDGFAGMLLMGSDPGDDPNALDSVEGLIVHADDRALAKVPRLFRDRVRQLATNGLFALLPADGGPEGVRNAVVMTAKRSPPFLAFNLAIALRFAVSMPKEMSGETMEFLNWLIKDPIRIISIHAASTADAQKLIYQKYLDEFRAIGDSRRH